MGSKALGSRAGGAAGGLAAGSGLERGALVRLSGKLPPTGPQPEGHLADAELDADVSPGDMTGAQSQ